MKAPYAKKAVQKYRQVGGNFKTASSLPLKKESDLASFYYPGIHEVVEKISTKEANREKLCTLPKTVGVVSTKGKNAYSVLTARAALLSEVAEVNALPLLLKYDKAKNIGKLLGQLSVNFRAIICADFSPLERALTLSKYKGKVPLLFHEQMQAASVVAAATSAAKLLKKTPKKVQVSLEGADMLATDIALMLTEHGFENLVLLDSRGPLYRRRPNMNKEKKELVQMVKANKDMRSYEEVLGETDIYISTLHEEITTTTTHMLPEQSVIISLKAEKIDKQKRQTLISTLPMHPNHITDLHIPAGIVSALCDGKQFSEKTVSQAIKGLATVYKTPKADRMIPGLLEKNMAKKVAKAIS